MQTRRRRGLHEGPHTHTISPFLSCGITCTVQTATVPRRTVQHRHEWGGEAYRPIDARSPDPVCVELLGELQRGRTMAPTHPIMPLPVWAGGGGTT